MTIVLRFEPGDIVSSGFLSKNLSAGSHPHTPEICYQRIYLFDRGYLNFNYCVYHQGS